MNISNDEKIKVLLVDDEELFRKMTAQTLNNRDFDVTTASNAEAALVSLDSQFFDVVLLDIQMPGMDGLELLDKLSNERPTQQIVMLTGNASISMAIEAMKLGAFDFLIKPCDIEELVNKVQEATQKKRAHDEKIEDAVRKKLLQNYEP